LAVANIDSDNVSVLLGVGDGTFDAAAGDGTRFVTICDLDGNGVPDLAAASWWDDSVSILLGVGDGTFAGPVQYATGDGPFFLAISDLDGDQVPDLVVANQFSDDVTVLLNQSSRDCDDGCTMMDVLTDCVVGANSHGQLTSCVARYSNEWLRLRLLSGKDVGRIVHCAGTSNEGKRSKRIGTGSLHNSR